MYNHKLISYKINNILDNIYYNNLKKIYDIELNKIFLGNDIPVFKPEYYIFIQNYFIYTFFYYLSKKKFILYSLSLHLAHISSHIYKNLLEKYEYTPTYNINFLKDTNYILFNYLLFMKILFQNKNIFSTIFLCSSILIFSTLTNINYIYRKRLKYIEDNKELNHFYKFLIITPNKNTMEKIITNTKFFNYSTYLFFLNIILYLFT
jgi:hypothetical protein